MKGISPIIAAVFVIAISIMSIAIVLNVAIPTIQKIRDSGALDEAYSNMRLIDNLINEVASEGIGSVRAATIKVTDGNYRINQNSGTFDYEMDLLSNLLPRGTFKKEGNIETITSGDARATQNSTSIILENEILEVVLQRVGNSSSFSTINTSTNIKTIRMKETGVTINPVDTSVFIGNFTNSSWGIGYSQIITEGDFLPRAEALFHIRSNATGNEYEIVYSLQASSDFLTVNVRNTTQNKTTVNFVYKIGSNANEVVRIGDSEVSFGSNTRPVNQTYNLDNSNYTTNSSLLVTSVGTGSVFYNASNGEWRNISELYGIGQGNWSYTHNGFTTFINYSLAGSNGYEYGIRDALAGGSYWLNETGGIHNLYPFGVVTIDIKNDFIEFKDTRGYCCSASDASALSVYDHSLYNKTGGIIWRIHNSDQNSWLVDNQKISNNVYGPNYTVYFFDWKENDWKVWQNNNYINNLVGWWKMDEGQGSTLKDSSNRGNDGTFINPGDIQWVTNLSCKTGACLSFNGNGGDGYFTVQDSPSISLSNAITVTAWVKPRGTPARDEILQKDNAWYFNVQYGKLSFYGGGLASPGYHQGTTNITANEWSFVAVTYDSTTGKLRLYVNGKLENTVTTSGTLQTSTDVLQNACTGCAPQNQFNGEADDIKMWNRALTQQEIDAEYRLSKRGAPDWLDPRFKQEFKWRYSFENLGDPLINVTYLMTAHDPFIRTFVDTGPVGHASYVDNSTIGYWQFDEGSGTSTADESGWGNTANLTNGPTWVSNDTCRIGSCLFFDGSDDYVNVGNSQLFNFGSSTDFTASVWFKTDTNNKQVFSKRKGITSGGWTMRISGNKLTATYDNEAGNQGEMQSSTIVTDSQWHLGTLVMKRNGNSSLYVDGVLEKMGPIADVNVSNTYNVTIGWTTDQFGASAYKGLIDDIRVWSRALTAEEVSQEYQRGARHNITIPASFGIQKTYDQVYEEGSGAWRPNQDPPATYYWMIYNSSGRSLYRVDGSAPNFNGGTYITKPTVLFHDKISNDNALFATSTWQAGAGKHDGFQLAWNDSDVSGKWDRLIFDYNFNSSWNSNFLFSLGYGIASTSSWAATQSPYTCDSTTFCGTELDIGDETFAQIGNSTLTYYDLKDTSLMGWWKFNDGNTIAFDSSGYNNTGLLNANVTWMTNSLCKFGDCLNFNGSVNYVSVQDSSSINPKLGVTVSAWVYLTSTPTSDMTIADKGNQYNLLIKANTRSVQWGVVDQNTAGAAVSSNNVVPLNNWVNIVGTYSVAEASKRIYINGTLDAGVSESLSSIGVTTNKLGIGSNSAQTSSFFNGRIDNVKIYSRALTIDEIKADYLATADDYPNYGSLSQTNGATNIFSQSFKYDGGAVGIWKFDEGSGINATDMSENSNHGALGNGTTTSQPTWITNSSCISGSCLRFDGAGDVVEVPYDSSLQPDTALTLEAWIYPQATPSGCCTGIISADYPSSGPYHMYYSTSNKIITDIGGISVTSVTAAPVNQWTHVIVTYDERTGRAEVYLNGKVDSVTIGGGSMTSNTNRLKIGRDVYHDQTFTGMIDEVRIYPRVLNSAEIWEHYSGPGRNIYDDFGTATNGINYNYVGVEDSNSTFEAIIPNTTKLYLKFNDNSTLNVTDSSSYGSIGRSVNGPTWTTGSSCLPNHGGCMSFDGSNDYVSIGNNEQYNISNEITIAAWIHPTQCPGSQFWCAIVKKGGAADGVFPVDYYFRLSNARKIQLQISSGSAGGSTSSIDYNTWTHVAVTYKPTLQGGRGTTFYFNGQVDRIQSLNNQMLTTTDLPVTVGGGNTSGTFRNNFFGYIDDVVIVNRTLSDEEIYQLYIGGMNRTVNDKTHRVVPVDGTFRASFNLTDHNNTLDSQDYDMRMLLINASEFNTTQLAPAPSCATRASLSNLFVCTYDNGTDVSQSLAAGLIYTGDPNLFDNTCIDTYSSTPKLNVTGTGNMRLVLPFTKGTCNTIGNKTDIIARQGIPSTPFASFDITGTIRLLISLVYDNIKLEGSERFGVGTHRICVKKIGVDGSMAVLNITSC